MDDYNKYSKNEEIGHYGQTLIKKYIFHLISKVMITKSEIHLFKEIPELKRELSETERLLSRLNESKNSVSQDSYNSLEQKYKHTISELKNKLEKLQAELSAKKEELFLKKDSLKESKKELEIEKQDIENLYLNNAINKEDYNDKINTLEKRLKKFNQEIKDVHDKLNRLEFYSKANDKDIDQTSLSVNTKDFQESADFFVDRMNNQLKTFAIFIVVIFFLPWFIASSDIDIPAGADEKKQVLWSWDMNQIYNSIEEASYDAGRGLRERINDSRINDNNIANVNMDKAFSIITKLQEFKIPFKVRPFYLLIIGIIALIILNLNFSKWYKFGFLVLLVLFWIFTPSILSLFYNYSSIVSDFIYNTNIPELEGLPQDVHLYFMPNLKLMIYSIFIIGLTGSLIKYGNKIPYLTFGLSTVSMILILIFMLMPIDIEGSNNPLFLGYIKAISNSDEFGGLLLGNLLLVYLGVLITSVYSFQYTQKQLKSNEAKTINNNQEIGTHIENAPVVLYLIFFLLPIFAGALYALIATDIFVLATAAIFLIIIGSYILKWIFSIAGLVISYFLNLNKTLL